MSLMARVLPPEEWPRLNGTEAELLWPHMNPEQTRVLVVEDEGRIVATWTLLRVVHAECLWVAPGHRGIFGVAKRLLDLMKKEASAWNVAAVMTGSLTPHVTGLIQRFGGVPVPFESFILPVNGLTRKEPVAVGGVVCQQ